jgi:hypothetical protein
VPEVLELPEIVDEIIKKWKLTTESTELTEITDCN